MFNVKDGKRRWQNEEENGIMKNGIIETAPIQAQ